MAHHESIRPEHSGSVVREGMSYDLTEFRRNVWGVQDHLRTFKDESDFAYDEESIKEMISLEVNKAIEMKLDPERVGKILQVLANRIMMDQETISGVARRMKHFLEDINRARLQKRPTVEPAEAEPIYLDAPQA